MNFNVERLWVRLLGITYLIAFGSFLPQIAALSGVNGITPAASFLASFHKELGARAYWRLPTLFWFTTANWALQGACIVGCLSAILLIAHRFTRAAAIVCFLFYLSLAVAGQPFTNFQWDALLLEAGFLAIFTGAPLIGLAYRFLLFRLMFESGLVKIFSHDPNWRNFHALRFHFLTQPLPNPIAYYVYRAPTWLLDSMTAATLVIEFVAPFLLFLPRKPRIGGAALLVLLQVVILLTGNYAFFNLLTIFLCVWAFDRTSLREIQWLKPVSIALCVLMAFGLIQVLGMIAGDRMSKGTAWIAPFEIVNTYGLFAMMTTTRPEVIIEGSNDGTTWREYTFRYKPGPLNRGLPIVAPYQPRLDWQMWFAALGPYEENPWVGGLLYRLLKGDPGVLKLMDPPPFDKPPAYVRAQVYEYTFTTPAERAKTGNVWKRELLGPWFGPASLRH